MNHPALAVKQKHPVMDSKRASEIVRTRWAMRDASEAEIREEFKTLPLPEALEALSKLRQMTEIISTLLNDRIGQEASEERCTTCGNGPKASGLWTMQGVDRDQETGLLVPYRFCSVMCVRERNRKRLMPDSAPKIAHDGSEMGDIR